MKLRLFRVKKDILPRWWKAFAGYECWLEDAKRRRGIPTYDEFTTVLAREGIMPRGALVGVDAVGNAVPLTVENAGSLRFLGVAQETHRAWRHNFRHKTVRVATKGWCCMIADAEIPKS